MSARSSKLLLSGGVCVALVVLVALFMHQHGVYRSEREALDLAVYQIERELKRARVWDTDAANLSAKKREVEVQITALHRMLPAKLEIKAFIDRFETIAGELDIQATLVKAFSEKKDFWGEASLSFRLRGRADAMRALVVRQHRSPRLLSWKRLSISDNTAQVELIIYAMPDRREEQSVEPRLCDGVDSRVWLWPYKGRIDRISGRLNTLCGEFRDRSENIRTIRELERKMKYLKTGTEVAGELKKRKTLPLML